MFISKIDGSEYNQICELHYHLKKNKVTQKDYYEKYYARACRHTGKKIEFKDIKTYFKTDFIDKNAMNAWFKANPADAKEYSIELLKRRKEEKNLVFAPCEVELRSAALPKIQYYLKTHGDYNALCAELGLKTRFDYSVDQLTIKDSLKKYEVICDTREQLPLKFAKAAVTKLEYGDYNCSKKPKLCVDRKQITDFIGSFFADIERLEREIIRAKEDGGYLVFLCEEDFNTTMSFDHIPHIKRHTKVKASMIFRNVRDLIQKYDHIQFGFCKNRAHMTEVIEKLFLCEEDISKIDIQYLIGKGVL